MDTITTNVFPTTRPYEPIAQYLLKPCHPTEDDLDDFRRLMVHRDYASKAYVIPERGAIPTYISDSDAIIIPRVTLAAQPTYHKRKNKLTDFERLKSVAQNSIERQIDMEVIKTMNAALPDSHTTTINQFDFQAQTLFDAYGLIEEHELTVGAVLFHPMRFRKVYTKLEPYLIHCGGYEENVRSYRGSIDDVPVFTSTMCPKNVIYITAAPEYVGALVHYSEFIESEIEHKSPNDEDAKEGVTITKFIGVAVVNDYAIARIIVS